VASIPDLRSRHRWTANHLTATATCIIGTAGGITTRGDPAARFSNGTVIPGMNAIAFTREVRALPAARLRCPVRASKDGPHALR
jgi:hypothetical protein